jgi:hypothetical protein
MEGSRNPISFVGIRMHDQGSRRPIFIFFLFLIKYATTVLSGGLELFR